MGSVVLLVQPTMHFPLKAYGCEAVTGEMLRTAYLLCARSAYLLGCSEACLASGSATSSKSTIFLLELLDFPGWIQRFFSFRSIH